MKVGFLATGQINDLGSILVSAGEKIIGGALHPSMLMGPNRILLENKQEEENLYEYTTITISLFLG